MITSQNRGLAAERSSRRADVRFCDSSSGASALRDRLSSLSIEIDVARRERTNVFLIGPAARCDDVIATLGPDLIAPIVVSRARDGLVLPPPAMVGTLILRDVDALVRADQRRLLDWLGHALAVKVISTATASLLPRIERGAFLDSLYYRLNTICILMISLKSGVERDLCSHLPRD
jgi:hypothetical protein